MYRDLFDVFINEANDLMNEFNELFSEKESCKNECNEEKCENKKKDEPKHKSYYHYVCDKFKNGENVYHQEKEVEDGKVLKDEGHGCGYISDNDNTTLKSESECKKTCKEKAKYKEYEKSFTNENNLLKQQVYKLQNDIKELEKSCLSFRDENKVLKDKISTLKEENDELRYKFNAIKSMFFK